MQCVQHRPWAKKIALAKKLNERKFSNYQILYELSVEYHTFIYQGWLYTSFCEPYVIIKDAESMCNKNIN